uniref:AAA domain-containing protein n=1 Tax=Syphacia muris TaxID=451379 RepID=A0A0N5AH33_9BILA
MDDDLYNAVNVDGDSFSQEPPLHYDDDDLNDLSRKSHRPLKRVNIENCEAIDWHMRVPCSFEEIERKRQKKEHDESILNRLTQRILQARKQRVASMELDENKESTENKSENRFALLLPPIDGTPWVTMNSPDCSRRFYIRLKKPSVENITDLKRADPSFTSCSNVQKARESLENDITANELLLDTVPLNHLSGSCDSLWVDKYAPHNFADLASDDKINRLLLNWIKLWDECVFHKQVSDTCSMSDEVLIMDEGNPRRPRYKIVLLAGPAGCGKTTLAKVVARHAGYVVTEVNASDDRNVADFEKRINGAVETVNTLDAEKKPICLLLDEIDGAPVDSIRLLCKVVARSGKKSIKRPIISICNNLYCPSLRELRSFALVLQMPTTDKDRLIRRLHKISSVENIRIDNPALSALVNACGFDLRLSINSLQYLAMHFEKALIDSNTVAKVFFNCSVLSYSCTNQQLATRTLFGAWSCILEQKNHVDQKGRLRTPAERAQRVLSVAEGLAADNTRFFMGLFTNYLNTSSKSGEISTLVRTAGQFCDYDILSSFINRSSNYSFMKYIFAITTAIHFTISSPNRVHLVYPTVEQNLAQLRKQSCDTLQCLKIQKSFASASDRMLVLDILPLFVTVVQPPLKQANIQLLNEREQNLFQNIVYTMSFYSITFKPQLQSGTTDFAFYPAIDEIATFPLDDAEEVYNRPTTLPKNTRQTIAHHIELHGLKGPTSDVAKENLSLNDDTVAVVAKVYNEVSKQQVVFRYNKGFSNAIRRNIRMRNLIFDS